MKLEMKRSVGHWLARQVRGVALKSIQASGFCALSFVL